jgi:MYXO-CTERM domain-containing protein
MWSASGKGASSLRLALGFLVALLLAGTPAHAVLQPTPGGKTIPLLDTNVVTCSDRNVEVCLDQSEGDPALIGAQADALVAPESFQPTCSLTFTPLTKGGGDHLAFGWYNLKPDPAKAGSYLKPTQAELYGMLVLAQGNTNGAQLVGLEKTLELAKEEAAGRYKGGQIGFFLAGGGDFSKLKLDPVTHQLTGLTLDRVFYTQHALNLGSDGAATFYQVLTWQSVKFKNSFYFGWEDRIASADADNDFDDLVFLVSGIQCTGGGEPCETGNKGVCKDGTQQCAKGELTCVQSVQPSAEKCNALDDDCNGDVDDGDLCKTGEVCDRGRCVPKCSTGEFRCALDLVCNDRGVCVEPACAKKDCPVGQVCHGGNCIDGCMGVSCPYGEVCRNGGCVDPCGGIQCDEGYSCVLGVCRSCACTSCEGTQVCHENVCVDSGCENQTCVAGSHCSMGNCVDDCAGTKCPQGQLCQLGGCVADPLAEVGGSNGTGGNGSGGQIVVVIPESGKGGVTGSVDGTAGTKATSGGSQSLSSGDESSGDGGSGCGCSIPGGPGGARARLGLLLLGALGLRRRRR